MNNQIKLFRHLRAAAVLTVIALFTVLFFQTLHAGHEEHCHEENCPICLVLQVIKSTNHISEITPLTSVEFSAFSYINLIILSVLFFAPATLVKQKVKLVI